MGVQRGREVFLNAATVCPSWAGWRGRALIWLKPSCFRIFDRALVIGHPEALGDEMLQVDPAPAHDTMHGPIRTGLDQAGQFRLLVWRQAPRVALGPGVLQPVGTAFVEAVDPVAQGLPVHAADPCRVRPVHPLQDRRQRQQPSALVGVLRCYRKPTKLTGREVRPHAHRGWHGAYPPRTMESAQRSSRKPVSQNRGPLV
jgi:hypothetical protein